MRNRAICYQPRGGASLAPEDFVLKDVDEPVAGPGRIVVETDWLSIDPYMFKALMGLEKSMPPVKAGEPMTGRVVARVIDAGSSSFAEGQTVLCFAPWQDRAAVDVATVIPIDTAEIEAPAFLGALGQSGITAWAGIFKVGALAAGETLVVSAAGGAVGSVAGQLARRRGVRVVGIAGGAGKCRHVIERYGFDSCVDYRDANFRTALAEAVPGGVDVYLENVGGDLFDVVLGHLNDYGRIAVCGLIAHYEKARTISVSNMDQIIACALRIQAFRARDYVSMRDEAMEELLSAYRDGALRYDLTVAEGLEAAPQALIRLLHGSVMGKSVVKVR